MNDDWLGPWRDFAAAWDAHGAALFAAAGTRIAAAAAARSVPYAAVAEAFSVAVRAAIDSASRGPAGASVPAIDQFGEFLRAQFGDLSAFAMIGPQRLQQERWERMALASLQAQDAQARLMRLWSDALREAAGVFAARCVNSARAEIPANVLYDEWIVCAEDAYARMAHTAAFCSARAALLNAQSRLRIELQALFERWCKELDLPTRSELNSVHRTLQTLRLQLARTAAKSPQARGGTRRGPKRGRK